MNNSETYKTYQKTDRWDIHYSSYYWKIYLDPLHTKNNPAVEFLTGYSKQQFQNEAQDVVHLLKAKILNLNSNGYFERIRKIEIFMRVGEQINKRTDPDIMVLYKTSFNISPENHDYIFKRFGMFLNEFYYRKKDNQSLDGILPTLTKRRSKDDFLDVNKNNFSNISQLYSHAGRCLLHGHSENEVLHFIKKYKDQKNWL